MLTLRRAISRDAAVGRLRMDGVELVLDARISCSLRCEEVAITPLQRRWRPWPFPSPAMIRSLGSRFGFLPVHLLEDLFEGPPLLLRRLDAELGAILPLVAFSPGFQDVDRATNLRLLQN